MRWCLRESTSRCCQRYQHGGRPSSCPLRFRAPMVGEPECMLPEYVYGLQLVELSCAPLCGTSSRTRQSVTLDQCVLKRDPAVELGVCDTWLTDFDILIQRSGSHLRMDFRTLHVLGHYLLAHIRDWGDAGKDRWCLR